MGILDSLFAQKKLEKEYGKKIGTSFSDRPTLRQRLLASLGYYDHGDYGKALEILEALKKEAVTQEERRGVWLLLGRCNSTAGNNREAIQNYRELLSFSPGDSPALTSLGLLLMNQGEYTEAAPYLIAAEKKDPQNPYAKNNLGALYYRMGDYEKAVQFSSLAFLQDQKLYQACTTVALGTMALGALSVSKRYAQLAISRGQDPMKLQRALQAAAARQYVDEELSPEAEKLLVHWHDRTARKSNLVYVYQRPVGRSYIGGAPLGEPPLDLNGKPMRQLCALFCEEFASVPQMPREGLLRIFVAEDTAYGCDFRNPTAQTGFRILYDKEFDHLQPGVDPGPSDAFPVEGCYGILPAGVGNQPMPMEDYRYENAFSEMLTDLGQALPEEDEDSFATLLDPSGHRMGGYPYFTQWDPREKEEYQKYDTLLFQLDSMDFPEMDIHIGDEGVMNFFIPEENLKRLDFSDVLYWWDCH